MQALSQKVSLLLNEMTVNIQLCFWVPVPPSSSAGCHRGVVCYTYSTFYGFLVSSPTNLKQDSYFFSFSIEALTEQLSLVLACGFFLETNMFFSTLLHCALQLWEKPPPNQNQGLLQDFLPTNRQSGGLRDWKWKKKMITIVIRCYIVMKISSKRTECVIWSHRHEFDSFVRVRN